MSIPTFSTQRPTGIQYPMFPEPMEVDLPVDSKKKEEAIEIVKLNGQALQGFSTELRDDPEVVLAAVQNDGTALKHASVRLQSNKDVVLVAVRQCESALPYASKELQRDRDVVKVLIERNGWLLRDFPEFQGDKEMALLAVRHSRLILPYLSKELQCDRDVVKVLIEQDGWLLRDFPEFQGDKEMALLAVRHSRLILPYLSKELQCDRDVVFAATEAIEMNFVQHILGSLKYSQEELKAFFKHNGRLLEFFPEYQSDKKMVLTLVKEDGLALRYASKELQRDPDVVLAAIEQNAGALFFCDLSIFKGNREIAEAAIRWNGCFLRDFPEFQGDKKMLLLALKTSRSALQYASAWHQSDPDVLQAVSELALETCGPAFIYDPQRANPRLAKQQKLINPPEEL